MFVFGLWKSHALLTIFWLLLCLGWRAVAVQTSDPAPFRAQLEQWKSWPHVLQLAQLQTLKPSRARLKTSLNTLKPCWTALKPGWTALKPTWTALRPTWNLDSAEERAMAPMDTEEQASAELKVAEAELGVAKAKLGVAEAELGVAKAKLGVAEANVEAATNDEDRARAESSVANAKLKAAQAKLEAGDAELEAATNERDQARAEADVVDAKLNVAKVNVAEAELGVAEAELGVAKAKLKATKAKVAAGTNEKDQTRAKSGVANAELNVAEAQVNVAEAALGVAKAKLEAAKAKVAACSNEADQTRAKSGVIDAELNVAEAEVNLAIWRRRAAELSNVSEFIRDILKMEEAYARQKRDEAASRKKPPMAAAVSPRPLQSRELGFVGLVNIPDNDGQPLYYQPYCFLGEGRHCKAYKGDFHDKPAVFKIFQDKAVMKQERDMLINLDLAKVQNVPVLKGCSEEYPYCCVVAPVGREFVTPPTRHELSMLLDVLKAAHKAGVVHRDPLPRNYFRVDSTILFSDWGSAEEIRTGQPVAPTGWPCEQADDMIDESEVVPQFRHDLEMFAKGIFLRMVQKGGWPNDLRSTDFWDEGYLGSTWRPVLNAARSLPNFLTGEDSPEDFVQNHDETYENFRNILLESYDRLLSNGPALF
ncbi:uncharacterized protein MONBRDRAFT_30018 [Monosiga brevicollis MX1]|uniref:Protein kinase domain-containing protein n=1 Tax=Monosiga brevicollis TaxID=81824 RepID=A9VCS4_MONBE|nr:uncharacterized protein MONBRDRAFT_30018 [Monosiga brevicollis MX1]EDQ84617.1 predicted protein [Monosiga brevicollis MX1]|eukprot:XP_001750521.1 hypothetical protein [Monosiga brevicollis MX1]